MVRFTWPPSSEVDNFRGQGKNSHKPIVSSGKGGCGYIVWGWSSIPAANIIERVSLVYILWTPRFIWF